MEKLIAAAEAAYDEALVALSGPDRDWWGRRYRHLDQLLGVLDGDGYRDARTLPDTCLDPETEYRMSSYGLPVN